MILDDLNRRLWREMLNENYGGLAEWACFIGFVAPPIAVEYEG